LVQTHGPYQNGSQKERKVQKHLGATHPREGVGWCTQSTLKRNKSWSKATI